MFTESKTTLTTRALPAKFCYVKIPEFLYSIVGLNATERETLGLVNGFETMDYTSIGYMADCIGISRQNMSERVNRLFERTLLDKSKVGNRVKYQLSQQLKSIREMFEAKKPKPAKPAQDVDSVLCHAHMTDSVMHTGHNNNNTDIKYLVGRKETAEEIRTEVQKQKQEKRFDAAKRAQAFRDKYRVMWNTEHADGTEDSLENSTADYIDYCTDHGYLPSHAGCERHLKREIDISWRNLQATASRNELEQAKRDKNASLTHLLMSQCTNLDQQDFRHWQQRQHCAA